MRRSLAVVPFIALVVLAGCASSAGTKTGGMKTERVDVPAPVERSADLRLEMRGGRLRLAGGAAGLLEGTLGYTGDAKPAVVTGSRETTAGKVVTAAVTQGAQDSATVSSVVWDLLVNGGLPTAIDVSTASGELDLDLSLADPKLLQVTSGSGPVQLRLGGPHPSLSKLAVTAQDGPLDVAATGEYPALEDFRVTAERGDVSVDLSGPWHKDATLRIRGASGDVTVVLPRDVNVAVTSDVASGTVSAEGLKSVRMHGGPPGPPPGRSRWRRAADKASPYTLWIAVQAGAGDVTLKVAPKK